MPHRIHHVACYRFWAMVVVTLSFAAPSIACTTAVISGKATIDGRPILWKNRDTSATAHNEVIVLREGRYKGLAVVNAGQRNTIWMGMNDAGFCIESALSRDLASEVKKTGLGNGGLMKLALETCATVADFKKLLEESNQTGRATRANIGVIDAQGGAAMFETGPKSFVMFDANDSSVAPEGFIVRANFSTSANKLSAHPQPNDVANIYSGERYSRACALLGNPSRGRLSVEHVLRHVTRDLADEEGEPYAGTVNGALEPLPSTIPTDHTISRTRTRSAAVFHGVRPGENAALTTMWTILGDPKFSLAVPCWALCDEVADPLEDKLGGELGEIAITLRDWSLTYDGNGIATRGLPGIWSDVWKLEDQLLTETLAAKNRWSKTGFVPEDMQQLHRTAAEKAMAAMQRELAEAKAAALSNARKLGSPFAPRKVVLSRNEKRPTKVIHVAVYDHSKEPSRGPRNLMRFLTRENGFECAILRPVDIRDGKLAEFDVLIMPGGSGSNQAKLLELKGREAICDFVAQGKGYVGICAGSYLASAQYKWSLNLINARVWDRAHWARGTGQVQLALSTSGAEALAAKEPLVDVYYGQGPLLAPGDHQDLPPYEVLAKYASEVAKKGAPTGAMVDMHAIVRGTYKQGRVICYSPHPEVETGPHWLMSAGIRWAAGADE